MESAPRGGKSCYLFIVYPRNWATIHLEILMTQHAKGQPQKPGQPGQHRPLPTEDVNKPKERAEQEEVAGRHKNSGQKDHKGAR